MSNSHSLTVPGDKSLTHRLLLLAGLAPGRSRLRGALTSLDARATAGVLRALGTEVSPLTRGRDVVVQGRARFRQPPGVLRCANSGTTARLTFGLLAGHPFRATLTGDASLRRRPMRRVTVPLEAMGAQFEGRDPDHLPLVIRGGPLRPLRYELPVSSAQLKGALLFAGLVGEQSIEVREPGGRSRDHTERLLRAFGFTVEDGPDGWIRFLPDGRLAPFDLAVPGDISSAAFLVGAGLLAAAGEVRISGVGLNPTRTGFLRVLERMGADVREAPLGELAGEPVGELGARPGKLTATLVGAPEIPGLIDEIPLLAVVASRAEGRTRFERVGELRVKESDRLALLAANLRAVGVRAEAQGDTLEVEGTERPPPPRGRVRTEGDHRLAMAFAVLGLVPGARVEVDDLACAAVSFPGFGDVLHSLEARRRGGEE